MSVMKTEAIYNLLVARTHPDLARLYNYNMECQVNVAQDGGTRKDGEFKGKKYHGWTDGLTMWKSFRIPIKASTEPEYTDSEMAFDLAAHAEGIGMTGWDWVNRKSKWVAFDFDAITGHSDKHRQKLTFDQLENVVQQASAIPWVTIRKSTSGKGLHLYVFLDDVPTANHNEHAALARSILGEMAALTGFDFASKVDGCGGNMWVWHRKMQGTDGLTLIKQGTVLDKIPVNWKDHVQVIKGSRRRVLPQVIPDGNVGSFETLAAHRPHIALDDTHKRLIEYLKDNNCMWWWDQDNHMLITHTIHLKEAHAALKMYGVFDTISTGADKGNDHNCYLFPLRRGAWSVRRYTPGIQEHVSWTQDGQGWTRCYLNRPPDFETASLVSGGLEDPKGGFVFQMARDAVVAAKLLGIDVVVAEPYQMRETRLKEHKDGRIIFSIEHKDSDQNDKMPGWLVKKNEWIKIFAPLHHEPVEPETGSYDDIIRHLIASNDEESGWSIKLENNWQMEPIQHIKLAIKSLGFAAAEVDNILGASILKPWKLVNLPFQPEYPGDRQWNRNAAQLNYPPTKDVDEFIYPTWTKILQHCGASIDDAIAGNVWCRDNGILNGADYLKCWIGHVLQNPLEPLPYLFFHGGQNTGKSIFHEAISLLLSKGCNRAESAITNTQGFNGELEGAIVCVIEEVDLRSNKTAYNKIKDWVTSREILMHHKNGTPYHVPNSFHFIQVANDHQACPVMPGDTRITMIRVAELQNIIPKRDLIKLLIKEAPDFLGEILRLELPKANDRLNLPCLFTEEKSMVQALNQTTLETFLEEHCEKALGYVIKFSDLHSRFIGSLNDNSEAVKWGKIKFGNSLPPHFARGKSRSDNQLCVGNIKWKGEPFDPDDKYSQPGLEAYVIEQVMHFRRPIGT